MAIQYVVTLLTLMVLVWVGTEGVGSILPVRKKYLAAIFGIALGLGAHGSGFLPVGDLPGWSGWPWLLAAVAGLLASSCTSLSHYFVKRLTG